MEDIIEIIEGYFHSNGLQRSYDFDLTYIYEDQTIAFFKLTYKTVPYSLLQDIKTELEEFVENKVYSTHCLSSLINRINKEIE